MPDAQACGLPFGGPFAYLMVMTQSVGPSNAITARGDFLAANRGLRVPMPGFVLLVHPNNGRGTRYGITVTKKIGNAVVRNRMKRRFRELLWAHLPAEGLPDHDHVLIGREGGVERDFTGLATDLDRGLQHLARKLGSQA